MKQNYSIVLNKPKAKLFRGFLRNIGAEFESSECGEHIYFNIYMKQELKNITETFLEKLEEH